MPIDIYETIEIWEKSTRKLNLHVTIQTILEMEPNTTLKCLCLDRNVEEIAESNSSKFKVKDIIPPIDLFQNNYYLKFIKGPEKNDIKGIWEVACGFNELNTIHNLTDEEELHIEYAPNCWYPLQNGVFKVMDPQFKNKRLATGKDKKWQDFPKSTRLGWRGPMIPIEKMNITPITFI